MKLQINFLKNLYLAGAMVLLALIISTPLLIRSGISIIREEY